MAAGESSGAINTMSINSTFASGGLTLSSYFARPNGIFGPLPGVILCHGFPIGPLDARQSAGTFPQVIDRMANEVGCAALTFTFRGCGASEGDFSLQGWVDDLRAAIDYLVAIGNVDSVWLVGTNTGASVALCVAADDPRVNGCVSLSGRADFDDWAEQPRRFLEHARDIGAIRRAGFPQSFDEWSRELRRFRPIDAARRFAPRPLMVLHGDDDESVPTADARALAEAHGSAELRIIAGAGHRLRHDPRALAVLFGWLDRERSRLAS
jgi:putative redox protein